jgi:hypothetical protein
MPLKRLAAVTTIEKSHAVNPCQDPRPAIPGGRMGNFIRLQKDLRAAKQENDQLRFEMDQVLSSISSNAPDAIIFVDATDSGNAKGEIEKFHCSTRSV